MEQHAVPQDITGFKFKLVGDMTLKQFGELAGGAVLAYLFYASGWHPFLKWPLVFFFGFLGFALAFLPIEERSLDIWIANFIKSIYQPTLYTWKKGAAVIPPQATPIEVTTAIPAPWPYQPPKVEPPPKEEKPVEPEPVKVTPPQTGPLLSIEELQKLRDQRLAALDEASRKLKNTAQEEKIIDFQTQKGPNVITVDDLSRRRDEKKQTDEAKTRDLINQNIKLGEQIESLKTKMQALEGSDTASLQNQLSILETQRGDVTKLIDSIRETNIGDNQIKVVDRPVARQTIITLTDVPNIINGVITNPRGVPLDSVILTVKDMAGNSIRALKTNQIGQFIASTPLENGTYYLEFERAGYEFDVLEIVLNGQVITPLDIKAKNGPV